MRRGAGSTDPVRQDAKPTNEPRRKASRDGMPRSSMRGASRGAEDVPERPTLRTPLPSMGSSFGGERPPFPESQPGFMSLGSRGSSRGPQREGTAGSFKKGVSWGASFSSRVQSGDSVLDSRPETGLSLPFSPTGRRSSDTAPISQEVDELQSQLNLLRERSWSEQQSLRRQLDDAKAEGEGLRRETEGAQLQAQQYSNELTVLRERAGTAAQLAEGGDALQLIDEKNMQIRHLEGLVKDLASAAMPSMPGGGGLRAAPAGDGAASAREATLQEEVERLVMQRDKEQEDLKELEQVVVQFEGRMGALKRENKELKRAGGELRQRIAEQEERGHQNTHHSAMLPPQGQGAGGEDRLRVVVDRLSEQLRDARQQGGAVLSLLDHMHAWRRTTGGAARAPGGGAREVGGGDGGEGASDREAVLEQKLLRATERAVAAEERKDAEVAQLGNVLDAERAQGGRMAQRLMSAEEGLASATPELAALRGTVAGLERELEFSKRRVEAAEADAPEGDAAAERLRDLQRDNLSLEEDVMSLRALLSNTRARFTTSRVPALALVVRSRTAVALSAAFQAWVLHTVCQRRVEDASERGGQRLRSRALGATTFHAWREGTTLCTREELKAAEGRVTALEEEVKGAGESVARADAQARALEDQCAQLERAAGASGHTEHALRALEGEHAEVVAAGARRDALAREVAGECQLAVEECASLSAALKRLEAEKAAVEAEMARLGGERAVWVEEKQRLAQKQATGAMTASEAGAALLRERCTVLSSQLALAGREHAKMSGALRGVSQLRSSLDALLRHVYLCKASIPVAGISDAEPAEGDTVEACLMIADNLRRECEPLIEAAAAHDRYGGTIPALSAEEAERFQPFNASQIVAKDMALLKQRVVVSEAGAAAAREEAREARGALLREGEAREDEGASHAAQLALAQNEARFLQEIADGGDVRQVFHATVRHLETFVLQVVARLGKKSGECLVLERQARTLSKEALGSAQALEAARRDMQIPAAPAVPQVEGEQERWQQAMDYAAALSAEVKEVTALWRAATGEIFELQSSALQHSAALSAAEETARGAEARGKQVAGERAGLAQQLAGASAQLEQLQRAGEAARVRAEAAAEEAADAVKRRREADAGREEALARLGEASQRAARAEAALQGSQKRVEGDSEGATRAVAAAREETARLAARLRDAERDAAKCRTAARECVAAADELAAEMAAGAAAHVRAGEAARAGAQRAGEEARGAAAGREAAERELGALRAQCEAMTDGSSGLEGQVRDARREAGVLKEENRRLVADAAAGEQEVEQLRGEVAALGERVADAQRALEEATVAAREEAATAAENAQAAMEELAVTRGDLEGCRGEAEEARRRASTGEASAMAAEKRLAASQEDLAASRARVEALGGQLGDAQDQLQAKLTERMQADLQTQADRQELSRSVARATEEAAEAGRGRERAEAELRQARQGVQEAQAALAAAQAGLAAARESGAAAQESAAAAEARVSELRVAVAALEDAGREGGAQARAQEARIAEQGAQVARLTAELGAAQQHAGEVQNGLHASSSAAGEEIESLRREGEAGRKERARLEAERGYLQERVQALKKVGEEGREEVVKREAALEAMQGTAVLLQVEVQEARRVVVGRDATVARVAAGWEDAERRLREQEEEMEDKDAAIETLRERMGLAEQAEAEAGHERRETERVLRAERDDLAGRMGRVEAEVRSVLAEVARAEGDVGMVVDGSNEAAARVEQARVALRAGEEARGALAERVRELEGDVTLGEEALAARVVEVGLVKERLVEAIAAIEKIHAERERVKLEAMQAGMMCEELGGEVAARDVKIAGLVGEVAALTSEGGRLEGVVAEGGRAVEALEAALEKEGDRRDEALAQAARVKEQLGEAMGEVDRQQETETLHLAAIDRLRDEVGLREKRIRAEQERVGALEGEVVTQEREAREVLERWARERGEEQAVRKQLEGDIAAGKHRFGGVKMQMDSLSARCVELEEENVLSSAKLAEYDTALQGKGRELARLHGSYAEAQALSGEAQVRLGSMQTFQEKLQRDVAAKDRQLKMYQSTSSLLSPSSGAPAGSEMNSLRRAAEEAEEEASALREQTSRLQVQVSKVERTAKQSQARADAAEEEAAELRSQGAADTGKIAGLTARIGGLQDALEQAEAVASNVVGKEDDARSKASTALGHYHASHTPDSRGRGAGPDVEALEKQVRELHDKLAEAQRDVGKAGGEGKRGAEAAAMEGKAQAASARRERKRMAVAFRGMADEVDAGEARAHSLLRLTVGCRRGVALRARERECDERFGEDLEQAVDRAKDAANQEAREQVVGLQKQVVESADALLASERKFSQLLAWVQKGKEAQLAKR